MSEEANGSFCSLAWRLSSVEQKHGGDGTLMPEVIIESFN